MSRSPLSEAAGVYLALGLAVISLTGKTPNVSIHKRGIYQPLRGAPETPDDWALIDSIFEHPDTTGVGILTGEPYVVVDIDGEEGAQQWVSMNATDRDGSLPYEAHWIAKTGRGLHLWYNPGLDGLRAVDDHFVGPGTIKLGSKLDLKGFGGYVAAPPSAHPDGGTYEWLIAPSAEDPPGIIPVALARKIADHAFEQTRGTVKKDARKALRNPQYVEGEHIFYAQNGWEHLIRAVKEAGEGNRNNMLHWAAMTISEEGGGDEEFDDLGQAALDSGLDPEETRRTIRGARRLRG